jgi:hypothetical protein
MPGQHDLSRKLCNVVRSLVISERYQVLLMTAANSKEKEKEKESKCFELKQG